MIRQRTLQNVIRATGVGLHSGKKVHMALRPAPANTGAVSTHLLEFSVTRGGGGPGLAADVLVRAGAGVAAIFVPAEEGLGLAIVDEDELNALEVMQVVLDENFARGDCNADDAYNISDAIFLLSDLFVIGAPPPPCADACDANDDGAKNIADVVYAFNNLFGSGLNPPAPFPGCGADPTVDPLGCEEYAPCP